MMNWYVNKMDEKIQFIEPTLKSIKKTRKIYKVGVMEYSELKS